MVNAKTRTAPVDDGVLDTVPRDHRPPAIFGVVTSGTMRRRPADIVSAATAVAIVAITAIGAHNLAAVETKTFELLTELPGWLRPISLACYRVGAGGTAVALLLALLIARRFRIVLALAVTATITWLIAIGLRAWVDSAAVRGPAQMKVRGAVPEYPVVILAVATTVILVAAPYLLRPTRHLVYVALVIASVGAVVGVVGLLDDIVGALALGWAVTAAFHLAIGSPAANPTLHDVADALTDLGVQVSGLRLADAQVWGESRYVATAADGGPLRITVIGRDAADARLFAKVWRAIWYKDSGPTVALRRGDQLEHRGYILFAAASAGVPASEVVISGIGGARQTAALVTRTPDGVAFTATSADRLTDAVLDDAWANLAHLHGVRLSHGSMRASNVLLRADNTTALVDFGHASSSATPERCRLDRAGLLASTAVLVGNDRALAAARRALGDDRLNDVLALATPAALPAATRHELPNAKKLLTGLRTSGGALISQPVEDPVDLRRVSPSKVIMALGTAVGVYLLIGQLANIDFAEVFTGAEWGWVAVAFVLSLLTSFTSAVALMGSVAAPLAYKAVVAEEFADNFTGLVGGTVATTALVIRFFQKQGQKVAVAASSGVLNSTAAGLIQVILVIIGLIVTHGEFTPSSTGGGHNGAGIALVLIVVGVLTACAIIFIPKLHGWWKHSVVPQWHAAVDNLKHVLSEPRQAWMLFGGNLVTQVLFALVLGCSLHAFGRSLPLMQLIVINSLASVLGGAAPVPGGMGVIEAGLIAGLTAAGVPQTEAIAATFTHRLLTSYLPPIWGWFALRWLQHNDYL